MSDADDSLLDHIAALAPPRVDPDFLVQAITDVFGAAEDDAETGGGAVAPVVDLAARRRRPGRLEGVRFERTLPAAAASGAARPELVLEDAGVSVRITERDGGRVRLDATTERDDVRFVEIRWTAGGRDDSDGFVVALAASEGVRRGVVELPTDDELTFATPTVVAPPEVTVLDARAALEDPWLVGVAARAWQEAADDGAVGADVTSEIRRLLADRP